MWQILENAGRKVKCKKIYTLLVAGRVLPLQFHEWAQCWKNILTFTGSQPISIRNTAKKHLVNPHDKNKMDIMSLPYLN